MKSIWKNPWVITIIGGVIVGVIVGVIFLIPQIRRVTTSNNSVSSEKLAIGEVTAETITIYNNGAHADEKFERYPVEIGPATPTDDGLYMRDILIRNNAKNVQNSLHVVATSTKDIYLKFMSNYWGHAEWVNDSKTGDGLGPIDGGPFTYSQSFPAKNIYEALAKNIPAYAEIGLRIFAYEYFDLDVSTN